MFYHKSSCYNEHGTMVLYDDNVSLTKNTIITNSSVEFITTFLIENTQNTLYIYNCNIKTTQNARSYFNSI
jgi:hypothetical protein